MVSDPVVTEFAAAGLAGVDFAAVDLAAGRATADLAVGATGTVVVRAAAEAEPATVSGRAVDPVVTGSLRMYAESTMGRSTVLRVSMMFCGTPMSLSGRSIGRSGVGTR